MGHSPTREATDIRLLAPENGAKIRGYMTDPFPPENARPELVPFTVRLEESERGQLELIAWFWNEIDRAQGRKRRKRWKTSRVIERFVIAQLDGFWHQLGSAGATLAERKEELKRLIAQEAAKTAAAKKPKK
jgi:hypothetical protein